MNNIKKSLNYFYFIEILIGFFTYVSAVSVFLFFGLTISTITGTVLTIYLLGGITLLYIQVLKEQL
tara:strand:- start:837 stop:1034 length:198 start_codon:yes stop_codon:yes gene_type:complete